MTETGTAQRIDKWLWHARFAKTRSLAQKLVRAGKVRVDRDRITSVSHPVRKDNVLTIAIADRVRVVRIKEIAERRGPYSIACTLYADLTAESKPASTPQESRSLLEMGQKNKRPDSRDRKKAIRLKQGFTDW